MYGAPTDKSRRWRPARWRGLDIDRNEGRGSPGWRCRSEMDNLNARIADATFRIYHRLNPCTVVIEREGRPTARLNAIVHNSSADFNLRAKGSFPVMTRVFIVDVKDSPDSNRAGAILSSPPKRKPIPDTSSPPIPRPPPSRRGKGISGSSKSGADRQEVQMYDREPTGDDSVRHSAYRRDRRPRAWARDMFPRSASPAGCARSLAGLGIRRRLCITFRESA